MLIIDRFEGDFAVCEDDSRNMQSIPREKLPDNACDGDVHERENGSFRVDAAQTKIRRERIKALYWKLKRK